MNSARQRRADTLERFRVGTYDVLVVGGGILGSRVAYEAASAGMRVALVDAGDFASATSSASSKLVHGGLRYLATGQIRLVRQAQRERRLLEARIAPPLVWPLPLVLAAVAGGTSSRLLPIAVHAYGVLGGGAGGTPRLDAAHAARLIPGLRTGAVRSAAVVAESQTNDARLVLATVAAAARAGADVANYVRLLSFEQTRGRITGAILEGAPGEGLLTIRCRGVVNCTGPWIDHVRRLEDPSAMPSVRLSKGVNIVLPLDAPWQAGLALFDSGRSVLAAPWHGVLLVGATDTPYDDAADAALVSSEDVDRLLEAFREVLPDGLLRRDRVLSACVGLRVLERGGRPTTHAARDEVLGVGPRGMVSVAGGKLTTHRLIAAAALRALPSDLRLRRLRCDERPITRPPTPETLHRLGGAVGTDVARYLVTQYGGGIEALVSADGRTGLESLAAGGPDVWAQAFLARDAEWALSIDDVVARRTSLELRGLARPGLRTELAAALGLPQSVALAGEGSPATATQSDVSAA